MNATLNARALLAISQCASNENSRYYLQGVLIEIAPRHVTYVATDGNVLAAYRQDVQDGEADNALLGAFIVPLVACKALKPKHSNFATLSHIGGSDYRLQGVNIDTIFQPIDGSFPNWRRVMPSKIDEKTAQHDPRLTSRVQETARILLDAKKDANAAMPHIAHNAGGPAIARWNACPDLMALIMPFRSEPNDTGLCAWFNVAETTPEAIAAE